VQEWLNQREHAPVRLGIQVIERAMKVFSLISFFGAACCLFIGFFLMWFFPWIFNRFTRATGPLIRAWSNEWVPSDHIPKACKLALVASEDTKFYMHHGIDFESLEQSYATNKRRKKIARGGSTITQQLVKNAFLNREKSYLRKARELAGAVLLDATLSKDNQLTWYFNLVEFGPRLYGIQAAARHYFDKEVVKLSKDECVSLVAVLPAPNKWNKSLERGHPTGFFASRTNTISLRMAILDPVVAGSERSLTRSRNVPGAAESLADQKLREETLSRLPPLPEERVQTPDSPQSDDFASSLSDSPTPDLVDPPDGSDSPEPEDEGPDSEDSPQ
jgi:monofunctional glycosyltransferase